MRKSMRYPAIVAGLMLVGATIMPTAMAAQGGAAVAPQPSGAQLPAVNPKDAGPPPTDAEIKHFVDAVFQVRAIGKQMRPQYDAAKTDADRAAVKQAAEAKMKSAIEHNDLTVERYKQIFIATQTDKSVHEKAHALVEQKLGK